MRSAFKTDVGRVRQHNEDHGGIFENNDGSILAVVADGMGGHQAGDVASMMTSSYLQEKWISTSELTTPSLIEAWLKETILQVNERLYHHANENPQCEGMGTTLVAAVCTKQFVTIAHIGDSRGYILNSKGLIQKTEDHSLVNELVKSGQISILEAENHPRRNVLLRALGTEKRIKFDIVTITWEKGNYVMLCSDGLSNKVSDEELQNFLLNEDITIDDKVDRLIDLANERGGEDNITVALVNLMSNEEEIG
ncbi:Stp1/IreP family PP2C-type Ser/Thr phosphatase [Anaerobacillus sp. MEB173]|uniref:Stp1/IreP family PP2C-type Ser/Thr phosphatase n=1 Tax=Anaerobacillus sp. MEB173 TaxID=3383345 RepID=UPI003F8FA52C